MHALGCVDSDIMSMIVAGQVSIQVLVLLAQRNNSSPKDDGKSINSCTRACSGIRRQIGTGNEHRTTNWQRNTIYSDRNFLFSFIYFKLSHRRVFCMYWKIRNSAHYSLHPNKNNNSFRIWCCCCFFLIFFFSLFPLIRADRTMACLMHHWFRCTIYFMYQWNLVSSTILLMHL